MTEAAKEDSADRIITRGLDYVRDVVGLDHSKRIKAGLLKKQILADLEPLIFQARFEGAKMMQGAVIKLLLSKMECPSFYVKIIRDLNVEKVMSEK